MINTPKPRRGYNSKDYEKATGKAVATYKKQTKEVKLDGIQDKDQRSSQEWTKRVYKDTPNKARSITYSNTKKDGSAVTVHKKGRAD